MAGLLAYSDRGSLKDQLRELGLLRQEEVDLYLLREMDVLALRFESPIHTATHDP